MNGKMKLKDGQWISFMLKISSFKFFHFLIIILSCHFSFHHILQIIKKKNKTILTFFLSVPKHIKVGAQFSCRLNCLKNQTNLMRPEALC